MLSSIRMSATSAHISLSGPRVMYHLSHITWMASFWAWILSRPIPPSLPGTFIVFRLMGALLPSQIRVSIIFCILDSTSLGIPCTIVRYCIIPPANIASELPSSPVFTSILARCASPLVLSLIPHFGMRRDNGVSHGEVILEVEEGAEASGVGSAMAPAAYPTFIIFSSTKEGVCI